VTRRAKSAQHTHVRVCGAAENDENDEGKGGGRGRGRETKGKTLDKHTLVGLARWLAGSLQIEMSRVALIDYRCSIDDGRFFLQTTIASQWPISGSSLAHKR